MYVHAIKTRIFRENENLATFICSHIKKIPEKSVLVITSKVVALAEGRTRPYLDFDDAEYETLVKKESQWALRTKYVWLTLKDGMVAASAGIDRSNADGKLVLLPQDSFASAVKLQKELKKLYDVKHLGVLITDSRLLPLRAGVVGVAVGYAGFKGLRDYRGTKDIFGRVMHYSRTDVADSLATAAVLLMGEGKERQPLALITGAPVAFTNQKPGVTELRIDPREDAYGPFFASRISKPKR